MSNHKTCSRCKQIKPTTEFGVHRNHGDGFYSQCLECRRLARKEYRERNKESVAQGQRDNYLRNRDKRIATAGRWAKENKSIVNARGKVWRDKNKELMAFYQRQRRAKIKGNGIFKVTKKELIRLYGLPCIYCGSNLNVEIDHVIPIDKGGNHGIGNLAPACMSCNRAKRNYFVMEWRLRSR